MTPTLRPLRVEAEAEVWPLYAPAAFRAGLVTMDLELLRNGLAQRLLKYGSTAFPNDPAEALWGDGCGPQKPERILEWLIGVAKNRLRIDGALARLQRESHEPMGWAEIRWRFLSLRVPSDILVAARAAADGLSRVPERVDLLHPLLRSAQPTAHLHLHLAGTGSTLDAWTRLIERLSTRKPLPGGPGEGEELCAALRPEGGGFAGAPLAMSWNEALRRALVAEFCIGKYLVDAPDGSFQSWVEGRRQPEEVYALWELSRGRLHSAIPTPEQEDRLMEPLRKHPAEFRSRQPSELLRAALHRWYKEQDPELEALLVQLIRVRCYFHQALVMDPTQPGLPAFRRKDQLATALSPHAGEKAWNPLPHPQLNVLATELRVTPQRRMPEKYLTEGEGERGWVIHYSRSLPRDPDPRRCPWPSQGIRAKEDGEALIRQVESTHAKGLPILKLLRGLDLAGEETEGPLWLFAPPLRKLREALDQLCLQVGLPGPGLSLHVGESFRHLATGLRAVHEPLLIPKLIRDGDRLGHALALGIDPKKWGPRTPRVWVKAWDRLLDLGWYRRATIDLRLRLDSGDLLRIQEEERELYRSIFRDYDADAPDLYDNLRRLSMEDVVALSREAASPAYASLHALCNDPDCWLRAQHLRRVDTAWEIDLLCAIQQALCAKIAERHLVIEVNPSSNLLVADLDHPLDQPMFHLRPVDLQDPRALPVCISADDPLTFATNLEDEVAYAWAGMVAGGVPSAYARAWIDEALTTAWRARFTLRT